VYIPPHLNANYPSGAIRNGNSGESRYSKEQLLDIYQTQKEAGILNKNLDDIFTGSWHPSNPRNPASTSWNSRGEGKDATSGPEVCWDYEAGGEPFGLVDMVEEEKLVSSSRPDSIPLFAYLR
jgi:PERQ amino acid-rich with GYF domain-containing protein